MPGLAQRAQRRHLETCLTFRMHVRLQCLQSLNAYIIRVVAYIQHIFGLESGTSNRTAQPCRILAEALTLDLGCAKGSSGLSLFCLIHFAGSNTPIFSVDIHPHGTRIATAGSDSKVSTSHTPMPVILPAGLAASFLHADTCAEAYV
jgi:hypothetical protein